MNNTSCSSMVNCQESNNTSLSAVIDREEEQEHIYKRKGEEDEVTTKKHTLLRMCKLKKSYLLDNDYVYIFITIPIERPPLQCCLY